MHQFPILDVFYRSRDRIRDPEPMIRTLVESALAAQVLCHHERAKSLRPVVEDLTQTVTRVMLLIGRQYLKRTAIQHLEHPSPDACARDLMRSIRQRLMNPDGASAEADVVLESAVALELATCARLFLREVDGLTGWKSDHAGHPLDG